MRVEKLPFTIYDIVGYFLPGAVLLASIVVALFPDVIGDLYSSRILRKVPVYGWMVISVLSVTVSYALGYVIALLSSEGIEQPVIRTFGYPSAFLVHGPCSSEGSYRDDLSSVRMLFALQHLLKRPPCGCGWLRNWVRSAFAKQLDEKQFAETTINILRDRLRDKFSAEIKEGYGNEWFSLVRHYVANNNESAFTRMYNYMTLYGFCRNLSAALYLSGIVLSIGFILPSLLMLFNSGWLNLSGPVASRICLVILLMFPLSLALAVNFSKFYRRYSHETIMAFVTMKDECKNDQKPAEPNPAVALIR
jgi:hypothetical protein